MTREQRDAAQRLSLDGQPYAVLQRRLDELTHTLARLPHSEVSTDVIDAAANVAGAHGKLLDYLHGQLEADAGIIALAVTPRRSIAGRVRS